MIDIVARYIQTDIFAEIRSRYVEFPKISFDYEVAEKAQSVAVVPFAGEWKDLGTWNTLTDELSEHTMGNVIMDEESENTHVINELGLPIMCIGTRNLVIAASNDGILISDKNKSENIKTYADLLQYRPMFEERRWGEYKVVNTAEFSDGYKSLTKQLKIKSGKGISYQLHRHRNEVWTFLLAVVSDSSQLKFHLLHNRFVLFWIQLISRRRYIDQSSNQTGLCIRNLDRLICSHKQETFEPV